MSCPNWEQCFHEACVNKRVCDSSTYWSAYWKSRTDARFKTCPYVHLCSNDQCKSTGKCQDSEWWNSFFNKKNAQPKANSCTKSKGRCDKHATCSIMNECIFKIPGVINRPALLKSLRGPLTMRQVVNLLKKHWPQPMRSFYLSGQKKKQ